MINRTGLLELLLNFSLNWRIYRCLRPENLAEGPAGGGAVLEV
jgi:hypothetical protein